MTASSTPAVRLHAVTKRFVPGGPAAVEGLDLEIARGSILALIGPSGCGKTTTLRMINRLIEPTSGRIEIDGRDTSTVDPRALRTNIGYVIQAVGLFPHRTVAENVAIVPHALGWDRSRIRTRVDELVDLVGLDREVLARYPDELSGGQQQRIGVARALAADPPLLLMDEPFGAVDPVVRGRLQQELLELQSRVRKTIVLVTHDIDEAVIVADRIALLGIGGRLAQEAAPDELLRDPRDDSVREFLGDDPSLRRLALRRVGGLEMQRTGSVPLGTARSAARAALREGGGEWLGIVDGSRFLGWVDRSALEGEGVVDSGRIADPAVRLPAGASLRSALDRIVTAATEAAVIEQDGQFLGIVTLTDIRRSLEGDLR